MTPVSLDKGILTTAVGRHRPWLSGRWLHDAHQLELAAFLPLERIDPVHVDLDATDAPTPEGFGNPILHVIGRAVLAGEDGYRQGGATQAYLIAVDLGHATER